MDSPVFFDSGRMDFLTPQILKITFTIPEASVAQIEDYHRKVVEVLESFDTPFVAITDSSNSKWLSGEGRIALGNMVKDIETRYLDRFKKSFLVMPNPMLKILLKGVNLVSRPKMPQKVFTKLDDAIAAAHEEVNSWS